MLVKGFSRLGIAISVALVALSVAAITSIAGADVVFSPTLTVESSTHRAGAHPDLKVTIENSSDEDIKTINLKLPDGFFGSLAAATKCNRTVATNGQCAAASQIGTVEAEADVVPSGDETAKARLSGKVYLTEDDPLVSDDVAGVSVAFDSTVGGIVLTGLGSPDGKVILQGSLKLRGNGQGIDTVVENIPSFVTDEKNQMTSFHARKIVLNLKSKLDGAKPPLLSNPNNCTAPPVTPATGVTSSPTYQKFTATFTGSSNTVVNSAPSYPLTACADVDFEPQVTLSTTPAVPTAGQQVGLTATVDLPGDSSSIKLIRMALPPTFGQNSPAYGASSDQCAGTSAPDGNSIFNPAATDPNHPAGCPPQSKVGTIVVDTPALPSSLKGDVYLIYKGTLPWLGIDISPATDAGNPPGVTLRLIITTSLTKVDAGCDVLEEGSCPDFITAEMRNIPDAPITHATLSLNAPDNRNGTTLSGKMLEFTTSCSYDNDARVDFTGTGDQPSPPSARKLAARVQTMTTTGCAAKEISFTDGVVGQVTTSTQPQFAFTAPSSGFSGTISYRCAIDVIAGFNAGDYDPGLRFTNCDSRTFTPATALANGIHRVFVRATGSISGDKLYSRGFAVDTNGVAGNPDNSAPAVSIDSGPANNSTTSEAKPTFTYSSEAGSALQCAIDDGAFLPCGTASGSSTPVDDLDQTEHDFRVRATDAAGNVGAEATRHFTVEIPFGPSFTATPTTFAARANPDLTTVIESKSNEDLKQLKLSLPNGFVGSLLGVVERCSKTAAETSPSTCPASSKVGTVDASAQVDRSVITTKGELFLTDALVAGDAAGLVMKLPTKVGAIDLGFIDVRVRLVLRGQAEGIDAIAEDIPSSITSTYGVNEAPSTTNFHLRRAELKLTSNNGGTQPLLVNPSNCSPFAFDATFTSSALTPTVTTASQPYQATGCGALSFDPVFTAKMVDESTGLLAKESSSKTGVVIRPSFETFLTQRPGEAGIKAVTVVLPPTLTISVDKLPGQGKGCSTLEFTSHTCPSNFIIGTTNATSPLLPTPLIGDVFYLRNGAPDGFGLPRVGIELRGIVTVQLIGTTNIVDSRPVTTFDTVPDVPIQSFYLKIFGGDKSILAVRREACTIANRSNATDVTLTGQNGATKVIAFDLPINCPDVKNFRTRATISNSKSSKPKVTLHFESPKGAPVFRSADISLPKEFKYSAKARLIKKGLTVTARSGNKKVKACFKLIPKKSVGGKLRIRLCGKGASKIDITMKNGVVTTPKSKSKVVVKKLKSKGGIKFSVKTVDVSRATDAFSISLRSAR